MDELKYWFWRVWGTEGQYMIISSPTEQDVRVCAHQNVPNLIIDRVEGPFTADQVGIEISLSLLRSAD